MSTSKNSPLQRGLATLLIAAMLTPSLLAQQQLYRYKVTTEVVLVNVTVRDRSGNPIRGLKQSDFTVLEDGKPQTVESFDLEDVDVTALPTTTTQTSLLAAPKNAPAAPASAAPIEPSDLRDHRLIVLFFDMSAMEPEEIERSVAAAQKFVDKQMTSADLVGVISLATSLVVNQDFTADRQKLHDVIARLSPSSGQGFTEGATGTTEGTADTSQPFTVDDTEYNIFNTDRRLEALQSVADSLARVQQKKSIIYFSSGMDQTGVENQAQLRNAINHAIRSNVSIYTMDLRGLQAMVPGGEAQSASLRGTSPYSGASVRAQYDSNFATQETLTTLAADTGGKAFLDSNDFNEIFKRVQQDTAAYYLLGYKSSNPARDGRYRKITVKVNVPGAKLEYRQGYYAPRDFAHSNTDDREQQLEDELTSELSSTDLDVYLAAAYFRQSDGRFFVPVSLVVPGSQIPFVRGGDKDKATLDIIGLVRDELHRPVGNARDTVKLNLEGAQEVRRKNVQYETSFLLPPGKFHVKFVLRENQSGRIGSFETDIVLPDFKKTQLKMSAVVLGTRVQPYAKKKTDNPLVREGNELIPNVTHVFSPDQHLYFYYEVYDPAKETRQLAEAAGAASAGQNGPEKKDEPKIKGGIRLLTSIQFFLGKVKAYETPLVEARQLTAPDRKAAVFQFEVPLSQLRPGFYTCQVNMVDDAAGSFLFPRLAILIKPPQQQPAVASSGPNSTQPQ